MTGLLERLSAVAGGWNFSILGSVYAGPGHFIRLSPLAYLGVLAGGAVLFAVTVVLVARFLSTRVGRASDRSMAGSLFASFTLAYLALGAYVTLSYPPTTDEPHYLALTDNILRGRGLDVTRSYTDRDFRLFYPGETLDPHVAITGDNRMFSQHTLGLPALILPGYALGGRWGVLAILAPLAGLLVAALYQLARRTGADRRSAALASGLAAGSVPLLPASTLVFTEVPAALAASGALLFLGRGWIPAVCASLLPWLHPRYALISAGLLALDLAASRRRGRTALRWVLPVVASGGAFLWLYHGPALSAVLNVLTEKYPAHLGDLTAGSLAMTSLANPLRGAFAKLLDRDFGVLPFAPWLLVLLPGIAVAVRTRSYPHRWILAGAGTYFLVSCLFRNWHGSAYPGRTLVPLAPFAVGYLALGVKWALGSRPKRFLFTALAAMTALTSWALTACPVLRYTSGHDWVAGKLGRAAAALPPSWFPSFLHGGGPEPWIGAALLALAMAVLLASAGKGRR